MRNARPILVLFALALALPTAASAGAQLPAEGSYKSAPAGLLERIESIRAGLAEVERALAQGEIDAARAIVLRLYLDEFEPIEGWWGTGGAHATPALGAAVAVGEGAFHLALAADARALPGATAEIRHALDPIERAARAPGVTLRPGTAPTVQAGATAGRGVARAAPPVAETDEISALVAELERGRVAYREGRREDALASVEHAYLEGFEPLESRLPSDLVGRIERAIHLSLRPDIRAGAPPERIDTSFASLYADLALADERLSGGASFWFGAVNAFAIIFREGLEAVLLVGAMLAYLGRMERGRRHQRQIFAGVAAGILASLATWVVAAKLIPVSGASREMVEGVTALVAVSVLLYVSHWLFQKTYIHDWKAYLEEHMGRAVTRGSALAMAGLAFAAVYREGFETVLFYQALMFDAGPAAVLAGFAPGILVISAIGYGIVKMGLRLPLKRVFAITGAVLLYLAFVFLGKGIYNLQEAGLFAPTPLPGVPDHEVLRQLFGLYPLAQTLLAQATFLLLLVAGALWYRSTRSGLPDAERAEDRRHSASSPPEPPATAPHAPRREPVESR
ncbi:MAG TPA: FTR1 family protein [Gemmatimonadota bacterium]|nr:FTR1 family protein [Gemmatimonadota bacterium]